MTGTGFAFVVAGYAHVAATIDKLVGRTVFAAGGSAFEESSCAVDTVGTGIDAAITFRVALFAGSIDCEIVSGTVLNADSIMRVA